MAAALRRAPGLRRGTREAWLLAAFALVALYHLVGVFPLVPVFGDGMAIANGATEVAFQGAGSNALTYRYSQHSGTYVLLAGLHQVTGWDTQTLLLAVSALCAACFVVFSALLIRDIADVPLGLAGLAVLLFQESYSGAYYGNSTVVAAAFAMAGLYLVRIHRSGHVAVLGGVLFGLSAWMRLDTILISPVVLVLLYAGSWPRAFRQTLMVGAVAAGVCFAAMHTSEASIANVFQTAVHDAGAMYTEDEVSDFTRRSLVSYFSILSAVLIVLGVLHLTLAGRWLVLAACLVGIVPFPFYLFVFSEGLANPRFIYYSVPFFAIPVAHVLWHVRPASSRMRWLAAVLVAVLFVPQYLLGVHGPGAGETRRSATSELHAPFSPLRSSTAWHLGPGEKIIGHNGGRLSTGLLWSPLWHARRKSVAGQNQQALYERVDGAHSTLVELYARDWTDSQLMLQVPLRLGYEFEGANIDSATGGSRYAFRNGSRIIGATRIAPDSDIDDIVARISTPGALFITRRARTISGSAEWRQVVGWAYERHP